MNAITDISQKAFQSEEINADGLVLTDTTRNPRPGEEDGKGTELLVPVVSYPLDTEPPPADTNARPKTPLFHPFFCDQPLLPGQIKTTALLTPK